MLDKFIQIIDEYDLRPDDIERVKANVGPHMRYKFMRENTLRTDEDFCFNPAYMLACAAYRINKACFQDPDVRQDPKIRGFMQKVECAFERVQADGVVDEDSFLELSGVEVVAGGKTFRQMDMCKDGMCTVRPVRTDEQFINKFNENALRFLPPDKVNKAAQCLLEFERLENVAHFFELISP